MCNSIEKYDEMKNFSEDLNLPRKVQNIKCKMINLKIFMVKLKNKQTTISYDMKSLTNK